MHMASITFLAAVWILRRESWWFEQIVHFVIVDLIETYDVGPVYRQILVIGTDEKIVKHTGEYAFLFICA